MDLEPSLKGREWDGLGVWSRDATIAFGVDKQ